MENCPFCGLGLYNIQVGERLFPMSFLAPHEPQAMRNHSQSLMRLAERGGLSWAEGYCVIADIDFTARTEEISKKMFLDKFTVWNTRDTKEVEELRVNLGNTLKMIKFLSHDVCPQACSDGAIEISENEIEQCQWCDELKKAQKALSVKEN